MLESYEEVLNEINNYPKKVETSNIIKLKYNSTERVLDIYNMFKNDKKSIFIEIKETGYGTIEFGIYDPDKNIIIISSNNL